jgi:hypothetical protein
MIVTGVILIILGYFLNVGLLYTIGGILLVVGLIFWLLGALDHPIGGRAHYW